MACKKLFQFLDENKVHYERIAHDRAYTAFRQAYDLWREAGDVPDYFNMLHSLVGEAVDGPTSLAFARGPERDPARLFFSNFGWPERGSGDTIAASGFFSV